MKQTTSTGLIESIGLQSVEIKVSDGHKFYIYCLDVYAAAVYILVDSRHLLLLFFKSIIGESSHSEDGKGGMQNLIL